MVQMAEKLKQWQKDIECFVSREHGWICLADGVFNVDGDCDECGIDASTAFELKKAKWVDVWICSSYDEVVFYKEKGPISCLGLFERYARS